MGIQNLFGRLLGKKAPDSGNMETMISMGSETAVSMGGETVVSMGSETTLDMSCPVSAGWAQTQGRRQNQEDSCWHSPLDRGTIEERGFFAAVSDGCGGVNNGELASKAAAIAMRDSFAGQNLNDSPDIRMLKIAAAAQRAVLRDGQGGCATLVSVLLLDGQLWLLSIGDSRISLVRGGGLIVMNRPHTAGKRADERAALTGAETITGERERGALSSCLGIRDLQLIDRTVNPIALNSGDQILLMSDGVYNTLKDEREIVSLLTSDPSRSAQNIIARVDEYSNPYQDNATVIVIRVQ